MKDSNVNDSMIKIVKKEGISAVWLVPIIAVLFGVYLAIQSYVDRGIMIQIHFDSAENIVAGKTEVRYKGLKVGQVTFVDTSPNLMSVIVDVEMIKSAADALTDKTEFWLVSADISLNGVSGLDTLLTGSYIAIKPDASLSGKKQASFTALREEPPLDKTTPGLHLVLKTNELGSLHKGAPVLHKQIQVGRVINYRFNIDNNTIDLDVFIEPEYVSLVDSTSRFWNASGFEITGDVTSGLEVKTQSLASIISGGIAFDKPDYEVNSQDINQVENGAVFDLFQDYSDAQLGYEIELILSLDTGLDIGDPIIYEGITIGKIEKLVSISPQEEKAVVIARVDPRVKSYLTENTQFYLVVPQIDLSGVTYVDALIVGPYIGIRPSFKGELKSKFIVSNIKPPLRVTEPGLHLTLNATEIPSLKKGSSVFYKNQKIGDIQKVSNVGLDKYELGIHIQPEFQHFVTNSSKFYNTSGVRVTGSLQGFEVQTASLQSILMGGISIENGNQSEQSVPSNGAEFRLYENRDIAIENKEFELNTFSTRHVGVGTRIMYRGERIGSIHEITRSNGVAKLTAGVSPEFDFILKEGSQFWLVKPQLSLSGVSDTDAIFGGAYLSFTVGGGDVKESFNVLNEPPAKALSAEGLQLSLTALSGSIASPGSPVSYRGIVVGQVDNIDLNDMGDKVTINVSIDDEYRNLIKESTRFYSASGVTISGSVGNFLVDTESLDGILRGGVSFFNADENEHTKSAVEGDRFTLFGNAHAARTAGIPISITFKDVGGLRNNMKIKYQDQVIGFVERVNFNDDDHGATVYAYLSDAGKKFAVKGTKFWLAKLRLGLVNSRNVSTLLEGDFIKISPGDGEELTEFVADEAPPVVKKMPYGLNITLTSPQLGSVRVGNPVLYKQVVVGQVIGVDLSAQADQVDVFINISDRYSPLVKKQSVFWNTSGFEVDAGVFSGVNITAESMETILSGGVAFATPESTNETPLESAGQFSIFELRTEFEEKWHTWRPKISIKE